MARLVGGRIVYFLSFVALTFNLKFTWHPPIFLHYKLTFQLHSFLITKRTLFTYVMIGLISSKISAR